MSILIKGINMPKEPWECPCHNGENGWCNITGHICDDIPKDCPLVEIQTPHGDLIDRDAIDICDADCEWSDWYDGYTAFSQIALDAQPIVIEGEE